MKRSSCSILNVTRLKDISSKYCWLCQRGVCSRAPKVRYFISLFLSHPLCYAVKCSIQPDRSVPFISIPHILASVFASAPGISGVGSLAIFGLPSNLTIFALYGCASPSNAFSLPNLSSLNLFFGNMPLTAFRNTSAPPSFSINPSIVICLRLPGLVLCL
jgi:hypothetical protein